MTDRTTLEPNLWPAGLLLGIGMGGFFDGILFHQILQVHAMLSARLPMDSMMNMKVNMTADGIFHAFTWTATLIGIALLWRTLNRHMEVRPSGLALVGTMLAGWGWFNLVEGLIDHHLLGLHQVVQVLGTSVYDWLYLASGVLLILAGHLLVRRAQTAAKRSRRT